MLTVESLATVSGIEKVPAPFAVPVARLVVHVEFEKSSRFELASALPVMFGLLLFEGESGELEREEGELGANESSIYVTLVLEQALKGPPAVAFA